MKESSVKNSTQTRTHIFSMLVSGAKSCAGIDVTPHPNMDLTNVEKRKKHTQCEEQHVVESNSVLRFGSPSNTACVTLVIGFRSRFLRVKELVSIIASDAPTK